MSPRPFSSASKSSEAGGIDATKAKPRQQLRRPNRQMRERRTAYAMMAFGLLLGGLELFIVFHYV